MSDEKQAPNWGKFYEGYTTLDLIRRFAKLQQQKEAMDTEVKNLGQEIDYLAKVAIPTHFTDEGIKNMNVEGLGRVSLRSDIYASIKAGMKDQLFRWLDDIGSKDLIQPGVNPSTLKAFIKERIKKGEDYPEDFVNVTAYQQASITKA